MSTVLLLTSYNFIYPIIFLASYKSLPIYLILSYRGTSLGEDRCKKEQKDRFGHILPSRKYLQYLVVPKEALKTRPFTFALFTERIHNAASYSF